jgi:hypothetical protein
MFGKITQKFKLKLLDSIKIIRNSKLLFEFAKNL